MPERKVIIITGAGSGIGRAVALQAARNGYAVLAVSIVKSSVEEVAAEIVHDGGTCVPITLDVTLPDAPARIVEAAKLRFGRVDVVLNNAGYAKAGALLEQSDADIDAQWQVHVAAPLRIARAALPLLRESRGQLMFMGSGLARVPAPYYGTYCAAKAAVRTAVVQLRRELRESGVAVTYVDPGSVRTNFAKDAGILASEGPTVSAEFVAKRILRAVETRQPVMNAVPLHSLVAMLGEWFPRFTDRALAKKQRPVPVPYPQPQPGPAPSPAPEASLSDFDRALEPVARRMERVKLPAPFLAELLLPGSDVHLGDAAMRWAGMPNKNERAAMAEALEALTAGGFLERTGEETWRVVRSAH